MKAWLTLRLVTVAVASSYLTIGLVEPDRASALWAPYAVVMFVLAVLNLLSEEG